MATPSQRVTITPVKESVTRSTTGSTTFSLTVPANAYAKLNINLFGRNSTLATYNVSRFVDATITIGPSPTSRVITQTNYTRGSFFTDKTDVIVGPGQSLFLETTFNNATGFAIADISGVIIEYT